MLPRSFWSLNSSAFRGVAHFVNFVVLIAALSSANANLYAGARLLHSLAADGMAPRQLAQVNRAGVPARAVWASTSGMVIAILLALYSPKEAFLSMIFVIMVCALTVWVLILFAYIVYKRVEPAANGFRLWGGRSPRRLAFCCSSRCGLRSSWCAAP